MVRLVVINAGTTTRFWPVKNGGKKKWYNARMIFAWLSCRHGIAFDFFLLFFFPSFFFDGDFLISAMADSRDTMVDEWDEGGRVSPGCY